MTRPFRFDPPQVQDAVVRRRVQRVLVDRFDRRVTLLEAGPGFGKTTALVRAMAENLLTPRGTDLWFGCEPADEDARSLLTDLATVTGADRAEIAAIAAALAERGDDVCLVIDDVHELPTGSAGAGALDALVNALPARAHLVLASRTAVPCSLARLEAQRQVARLGEDDLALQPDEVRALSGGNAATPATDFGGWPALVSLAALTGRTDSFLWEEVLTALDAPQRALLTALVAVHAADLELLHTLAPASTGYSLAGIPMVHERAGRYEAHALWREQAGAAFDTVEARALATSAVEALLERGDPAEAVEVCLRAGLDEPLLGCLRRAAVGATSPPSPVIRRWYGSLDAEGRASGVGLYLAGLVERDSDPSTDRCRDRAIAAAEAFRAQDDADAEAYALGLLGYWYYKQGDTAGLTEIYLRLTELEATGCVPAAQYVTVSNAVIHTVGGDAHAALDELRTIDTTELESGMAAIADWLEANARNVLGFDATEVAERGRRREVWFPGVGDAVVASNWKAGRVDRILDWLDQPPGDQGSRQEFIDGAWRTYICAGLGRLEEAREHFAAASIHEGEAAAWQIKLTAGFARILLLMEAHEDEAAEVAIRDLVAEVPLEGAPLNYYRTGLSGIYRLVPETRELFDGLGGGPLWFRDLGLVQAHVAALEGDLGRAATIRLPDPASGMLSVLLGRGSWELLAAARAAGNPDAGRAVEQLLDLTRRGGQRTLRGIADHGPEPIAAAAKDILANVPVAPDHPVRIALLGPGALHLGEVESDSSDFRRERVRALMGYLVLHPVATREAATAALWPDADPDAGRRNFRSTLNLLNGALEPHRRANEATAIVRTDGARITVASEPWLIVDVWELDRLLEEAATAEAHGTPSEALTLLLEALDLYRGDLLGDAGYADWVTVHRERLRANVVDAGVRAASMLATADADRALEVAQRVLEIEPWSEQAHRVVIGSHMARGNEAAARRAIDTCRAALEDWGGPTSDLDALVHVD